MSDRDMDGHSDSDQNEQWDGRCRFELCTNWSGDGRVCVCAAMDIEPPARPWF